MIVNSKVKRYTLLFLGWFFIVLGTIGILLPLLPTTPFLLLALACFSRSSPRFYRMLLDNKWFGPPLQQWEQTKTVRRSIKKKVFLLIIVTFSVSIAVLAGRLGLQLMLACFAVILLGFIYRLNEPESPR
ncbi:MAG: hypothetical protein COA90_06140 [Gammaproteobacteria bacterium]|nr:MAG: hypothetical protein COA90_06140 [Gammaproteobacteria bacterium]